MAKNEKKKGRYEVIYTKLLNPGSRFLELSSDARLVWYTLKVCRFNNAAGLIVVDAGTLESIREMTGLTRKAFRKAFDSLSDRDWIAYGGGIVWVKKALENNPFIHLNNEKQRPSIIEIVKNAPKSKLILEYCELYGINKPFDSLPNTLSDSLPDTYNLNLNSKSESKSNTKSETKGQSPDIPFQDIIEHLNESSGHRYEATESVTNLISKIWVSFPKGTADSKKLETFYNVHHSRVKLWAENEKMQEYLRPKTLYAKSNFWNYAGQADKILGEKTGEPF